MMGYTNFPMYGYGYSLMGLVTWLLVITFLILGIAYFWKELNKKEK